MITTVLFVIAIALAIPTFGISFIVFVLLKLFYDRSIAELLAKNVFLSFKNGSETYELFRVNRAAIRRLFLKYGTQNPEYNVSQGVDGLCYMGTVSFAGVGDLAAFVNYKGDRVSVHAVKEPEMTIDGLLDGSFVNELVAAHVASATSSPRTSSATDDEVPF